MTNSMLTVHATIGLTLRVVNAFYADCPNEDCNQRKKGMRICKRTLIK